MNEQPVHFSSSSKEWRERDKYTGLVAQKLDAMGSSLHLSAIAPISCVEFMCIIYTSSFTFSAFIAYINYNSPK